jgi:hypothetical protein
MHVCMYVRRNSTNQEKERDIHTMLMTYSA